MASIQGTAPAGADLRLVRPDGTADSINATADRSGAFRFPSISPDWYILSIAASGFREAAKAVRVENGTVDIGKVNLAALPRNAQAPAPILTVCEALDRRDSLSYQRVIIVGIFKSGMDETLRLDCPEQLVSGDVGWPSAIGLTRPSQPPETLRAEIEKKRQEVIKSSPPEAPLRPERVVGLYGYFVSVAGLKAAACCKAQVETVLPPARLFGLSETDRRVIR